jgi:diphthine-ammonia ligase
MRLAVLFSGGKDSCLACMKAMATDEVACLVSLVSKNPESYLFHTPNNSLLGLQAEAMGIPLVRFETDGVKEAEVEDLKRALALAKERHAIEGVVTGAVGSVYQATRIQRVCDDLGLWCFNPLWQRDQISILQELVEQGFCVIIAGVYAEPLGEHWLGEEIDEGMIEALRELQKTHKINPAGEGGEIETTVLDAPFFAKRIEIVSATSSFADGAGTYDVVEAKAVQR